MTIGQVDPFSTPVTLGSVSTEYDFEFKASAETEIVVQITQDSDGALITPTYSTHYTVTLNADQSEDPGGTVVINETGLALVTGAAEVVVLRETPNSQGTALPNQGPFYAQTVEAMLDKVTAVQQENALQNSLALSYPVGTDLTEYSSVLPVPVADQYIVGRLEGGVLKFKSDGASDSTMSGYVTAAANSATTAAASATTAAGSVTAAAAEASTAAAAATAAAASADAAAEYDFEEHTHAIADVTDLQTTLDAKAASSHTHTVGNVTGLQDALDLKQDISTLPAGSPTGVVLPFAGDTAPEGWLMCSDAAFSRTTYADLFAVCGTVFGAGDGSTTFNIPNPAGRSIIGVGTGSGLTARAEGATGGAEEHTLSDAEMPSHSHTYSRYNSTSNGGIINSGYNFNIDTTSTATNVQGSDSPHNNMPPWLAMNFIIKT